MLKRPNRKKLNGAGGGRKPPPDTGLEFIKSGCTALDCVLGGGWAANGRVFNIVGDRCLSGDTIVSAKRGTRARKMPIHTLYERVYGNHFNRNDELETSLLADVGGYVGMVPIVSIQQTGLKKLYEITDEHGNSIKASEDHQFATSDGWRRLSDGLNINSSVKRWHSTRNTPQPPRPLKKRSYTYSIPFHPFGQRNFVAGRDYKRLPTGRLVIEAAINGLELCELIYILRYERSMAKTLQYTDPAFDLHHRNGNCQDDRLDNLELIEPEEHWAIHAEDFSPNTRPIELSKITSIVKAGEEPTFDITMEEPYHNFIANGFVVHNSTGKTALVIEACTNFGRQYSNGLIWYRESESAFLDSYAASIGAPMDRIKFIDRKKQRFETIEDFYEDLNAECDVAIKKELPGLYILDSLDALSDNAELKRKIDEGAYPKKPRLLSEMFRRITRKLERAKVTLGIVSQVRTNIGATFGRKTTRSGGKALDFYASQILYLAHLGVVTKTIDGQDHPVGVRIRGKCDKNKVAPAFKQCDFTIQFNYGIDDLAASLQYLIDNKRLDDVSMTEKGAKSLMRKTMALNGEEYKENLDIINEAMRNAWLETEEKLKPSHRKYE